MKGENRVEGCEAELLISSQKKARMKRALWNQKKSWRVIFRPARPGTSGSTGSTLSLREQIS